MNKITSNIIKGLSGRLHASKNGSATSELSWLQEKIIKHQDDQLLKMHQFKTFKVYYKRPYEFLHTYQDIFVNEIYKFKSATDKPVIIDCGANIGLSVLYFKLRYPHASIEAFEPDVSNFEILSQNCNENRLSDVHLNKAAVWTLNGTISFSASESEASHITEENTSGDTPVAAVRLAEILQRHEITHFLKMDIEGAEWNVVTDIANELKYVENFFLEYHGKSWETYKLNDIMGILKSSGFSVYIKNAADNLQHPFVEKTTATLYDVQLNIFCYRN